MIKAGKGRYVLELIDNNFLRYAESSTVGQFNYFAIDNYTIVTMKLMNIKMPLCALCSMLCIVINAQFKEGYYFDKNNNKVAGLLKIVEDGIFSFKYAIGDGSRIVFKENEDAKAKTFSVNDITSFVIGEDSFAIVKNFPVPTMEYTQDFAKVVEIGRINLYMHSRLFHRGMQSSQQDTWLIEKNRKIGYLTKKRFTKIFIEEYISDFPDLVDKINNKVLKYGDLQEVIRTYNKHFEQGGAEK